ncbi:MAG: threonine--tRNA ligase [Thermoproteota archaeon]|jgi:threonyl-tRNA synthetase|nr:threonine--tRNA ligase [Thermoproteota archaeon]
MPKTHLEIGQELDIFTITEEGGSGLPLFKPKGFILREELIKLMREINSKLGYQEVWTPHLFKLDLWKISGHLRKYKDRMFILRTKDERYAVKPMNCPGHCLLYKSEVRSYRDLPVRYSEFGTVYRNEQSGELVGLLRVRAITQDDGHAFIREDQIEEEVNAIIKSALEVLSIFEMKDFKIKLSTRPDQYIGSIKLWDKATKALKNCLDKNKLDYEVKEKEGAFYGPKIDIDAKDSLGRYWQCTTIQLDFNLPRRFKLTYINKEGKPEIPVMIHRAILGSLERFIGVLLEHYQGKLPFWCSPEQIRILPISEKFLDYARSVKEKLSNFRVEIDDSNNTLEKKIFNAIKMKVPYMIILGKKELENNTITVRDREGKQLSDIKLEEFIDIIKEKVIFRK